MGGAPEDRIRQLEAWLEQWRAVAEMVAGEVRDLQEGRKEAIQYMDLVGELAFEYHDPNPSSAPPAPVPTDPAAPQAALPTKVKQEVMDIKPAVASARGAPTGSAPRGTGKGRPPASLDRQASLEGRSTAPSTESRPPSGVGRPPGSVTHRPRLSCGLGPRAESPGSRSASALSDSDLPIPRPKKQRLSLAAGSSVPSPVKGGRGSAGPGSGMITAPTIIKVPPGSPTNRVCDSPNPALPHPKLAGPFPGRPAAGAALHRMANAGAPGRTVSPPNALPANLALQRGPTAPTVLKTRPVSPPGRLPSPQPAPRRSPSPTPPPASVPPRLTPAAGVAPTAERVSPTPARPTGASTSVRLPATQGGAPKTSPVQAQPPDGGNPLAAAAPQAGGAAASGRSAQLPAGAHELPRAADERQLKVQLRNVISRLKKEDKQGWFAHPVTDADALGYSLVVRRPMCFDVLYKKVSTGEIRTFTELRRDIDLMFLNGQFYNPPTHFVFHEVMRLRGIAKRLYDQHEERELQAATTPHAVGGSPLHSAAAPPGGAPALYALPPNRALRSRKG